MTTPEILPIGESRHLERLRLTCSVAPPGLWLAGLLLSAPAGALAAIVSGLALGAVALLLRDACRRLDPQGYLLLLTRDAAPAPALARSGVVRIAADLRAAIWLLPEAESAAAPALLLFSDALGDARWRVLRQRLALGSTLWLLDAAALREWHNTVSLPTASVSG